jgi:hypothetical protein
MDLTVKITWHSLKKYHQLDLHCRDAMSWSTILLRGLELCDEDKFTLACIVNCDELSEVDF